MVATFKLKAPPLRTQFLTPAQANSNYHHSSQSHSVVDSLCFGAWFCFSVVLAEVH